MEAIRINVNKPTTLNQIEDFLKSGPFVLYGVSKVKQKFGNTILKELIAKGFRIFPMYKNLEEIENIKCYKHLSELPEKVGAAIVCTKPEKTAVILEGLKASGIKKIWLQQGSANSGIYEKALMDFDSVIYHKCILMFAIQTGMHQFHARILRFFGSFPKRAIPVK
ncbi:MAG: CoA-binding protein [Mariniphaga sp.]